jgi:hypothetical protein
LGLYESKNGRNLITKIGVELKKITTRSKENKIYKGCSWLGKTKGGPRGSIRGKISKEKPKCTSSLSD